MSSLTDSRLPRLWSSGTSLADPVEALLYASNLLGSDPRITNFGGGNTSVKVMASDPLTDNPVEVLWVKGSGGDLGSAKRTGFASLYQDKLLALIEKYKREQLNEDDMVALYAHCTFNLNPAVPSIDTPLHAFVPRSAVSHLHSDSMIAIAACKNSEELTKEIFSGRMGFLPWKRPGFDLGLALRELYFSSPHLDGAIMESHGFICWADDWESCYELSLELIDMAQSGIDGRRKGLPFGASVRALTVAEPVAKMRELMPIVRGLAMHDGKRLIASSNCSDSVLEFLSSEKCSSLVPMGTSCPDHFLRTKIRPIVLEPTDTVEQTSAKFADYRSEYSAYYERCKRADSPEMRNPNPSVVLIPEVGMISLGKNAQEARVTGEFYRNAINVMRGAETISRYKALPEQEAFDIEYWLLEEAKLKRMPPELEFSRQVCVITGGAQGIGRATSLKLARAGACVVLLDVAEEKLDQSAREIDSAAANRESVLGVVCDVTDSSSLCNAFDRAIDAFGGIDLVVVCAGNARRGTIVDTTPDDYEFMDRLLIKAYFETISESCKRIIAQGTGGSIVVVASKNGTAVGQNAAMYSAAKAFELHLMRTVAADMSKHGIRCNAINPDAVLEGSGIWNDKWKHETATVLGIKPDQLQEHYRKRTLLGRTVSADDCAEAIAWLLSETRSSRTTGCVITVDGGIREGFLR